MHKVIITEPAGVIINTKHHAQGVILHDVPPGIAKGLLHFKQARDIGPSAVRTTGDVAGGSPQEDFTCKLKLILVDEYDLDEDEAADLIKANTELVALGALGGDPALDYTAQAIVRSGYEPGGAGRSTVLPHPASRLPMVAGASPTPGGTTVVSNQPTAPFTQNVDVGGGIAAPGAGTSALPDGGVVEGGTSGFERTEGKAEEAAVTAAADKPLPKGKQKSK